MEKEGSVRPQSGRKVYMAVGAFWSQVTDACSCIMAAPVMALMSKTCVCRARARLLRLMSGMASHEKCRDTKATVCFRLPITR